jgi:chromosome segregation ATPase
MIIGSLEDIVTRLDMRVNTLELRLKLMDHQPELQPEPESPDLGDLEDTIRSAPADMLEETIRSLYVTIEGLKNQLYDAKRTERDLDAEIVALQKENHRLTRLAWQAEQDKRGAEAIAKAAAEELEQIKQHNDDLARDAGALIGARALNEALTQKQHMLEAKNRDLEERLEWHRDCIDRTADALELLGFRVFAPTNDRCDND